MTPMPLGVVKQVILTMSHTRARIPHHGLWSAAVSRYFAQRKQRKKSERDSNSAGKDVAISFENDIERDSNSADKDGAISFKNKIIA